MPKKAIFLIEENNQFCRLLSENLIQLGYQVIAIHLLSEVLNLLITPDHREEREVFDLIILGEILTLEEKAEILNWASSNQNRTPILVISPTHSEEEKQQYLELGANDYLGRPFTLAEVVTHCQNLLND